MYNLGPLSEMSTFIDQVVDESNKEYVRQWDNSRLDKVISKTSSTIHNLQKIQKEQNHLPLSIWQ